MAAGRSVELRWREWTRGATFEPFTRRDSGGHVTFANRMRCGGRFLDRCWPVCRPFRRNRLARKRRFWAHHTNPLSNAIDQSARLADSRRWLCGNPLFTWALNFEQAKRGSARY